MRKIEDMSMKNHDNEKLMSAACDLVDSIIAGRYDIPREMTFAINRLQDVVYESLDKDDCIKNHLTTEYTEFRDKVRGERLGELMKMRGSV